MWKFVKIRDWILIAAVPVLFTGTHSLPTSKKQHYVIGGWIPGTPASLLDKWSPVFQTYLTETVGQLYDPPIDFTLVPVDYDSVSTSPSLIQAGHVDFIYTTPGSLVCLDAQFGFSPIATQRQLSQGMQSGAIGSAIYSMGTNGAIKNISDFVDKKIAVGQTLAVGSFQLGVEVIFYQSDYTRQMEDIQQGNVDVALVLSGWLESNFPQNIPEFHFHHLQQLEYQSEPYPFLTSTSLVPQFGLAAAPQISPLLRQQIVSALVALNATAPAAQAAGIAGFTLPASYSPARTLAEDLGIMFSSGAERQCHSQFESAYSFVSCPAGYVKDSEESAAGACGRAGLPCPRGLTCLCRPCIPDRPVNMFPWQVVLGLCTTLFVVTLCLALSWRAELEAADLLLLHAPAHQTDPLSAKAAAAGGGWSSSNKRMKNVV